VLPQPHHRHVGEALLPHRLHQRPRHLFRRPRCPLPDTNQATLTLGRQLGLGVGSS
jgi:hypothetical protein